MTSAKGPSTQGHGLALPHIVGHLKGWNSVSVTASHGAGPLPGRSFGVAIGQRPFESRAVIGSGRHCRRLLVLVSVRQRLLRC